MQMKTCCLRGFVMPEAQDALSMQLAEKADPGIVSSLGTGVAGGDLLSYFPGFSSRCLNSLQKGGLNVLQQTNGMTLPPRIQCSCTFT